MRILYITNGYPPHRWAGTETYTAGIAEGFVKRGHEVHVLCAGNWEHGNAYWNGVSEALYNGVHVRRINLNWMKAPDPFRYLYDNPEVARYLSAFLQELEPDIVHVTSCETLSASVLQVVKDNGIPLILSLTDFWFLCPRIQLLHGDGHNCDGRTTSAECLDCKMMMGETYYQARKLVPNKILLPALEVVARYPAITRLRGFRGLVGDMARRKTILKHALTLPDYIVTASKFVRNIFVLNGISTEIAIQPYGHDLSWMNDYNGKTESAIIRLGYTGQIIEAKGVHLILQALRALPQSVLERISLVIYGNMESVPAYGQMLRESARPLSNVIFGGAYPHSAGAKVFSEIDILVVPSIWYDFPLVIHEAIATHTPVIATNLESIAENVVNEKNGLLFERGDARSLARQIERVVTEDGLLNRLGNAAGKVRHIDEDLEKFEQVYSKYLL